MKLRRIDFYPDDFIVGVTGMTPEQCGVYWMINALCYSSGGPIPVDDSRLMRAMNARPHRLKRIINELKTLGKLIVNASEMHCKRAIDEMETAQKRIKTAQQNGAKGGRPKDLEKPPGLSENNPPAPSPPPSPPTPSLSNPPVSPQGGLGSTKGSRLAKDWKPSESNYEHLFEKHALHRFEIDTAAEAFREYFTCRDASRPIKKDWDAAFYRWVRTDLPKIISRRRIGGKPGGNGQGASSIAAALRANLSGGDQSDLDRPPVRVRHGINGDGFDHAGPGAGIASGEGDDGIIIDADEWRGVPDASGEASVSDKKPF